MAAAEKRTGKRARWAPDGETVAFLRAHMEARGWGVVDLARFFECDRRVVTDWLAGRPMPAAQRAAIRKALEAGPAAEAVEAIARVAALLRPSHAATHDPGGGGVGPGSPVVGPAGEQPAPPPLSPGERIKAALAARKGKP